MRPSAAILALALGATGAAHGGASSASYTRAADVVDAGGRSITSLSYRVLAAAGQNGGGAPASTGYRLGAGYVWQVVGLTAQSERYTLTIRSSHGTAQPPAGVHTNAPWTVLTNSVAPPPEAGGTQYRCPGWTMTGHEPAGGSSTGMVMTVTNNAVLTWLWSTNFWRETAAATNGTVSVGDGWQPSGVTTQIWAVADPHFAFTHWTGGVAGGDEESNPLNLVMTGPVAVTACFAAVTTPVTGTPHWWLARYGLATNETGAAHDEGDGAPAWQEYVAGTDPTNTASILRLESIDLPAAPPAVVLRWNPAAGRMYSIEHASSLASPGFSVITSGIPAAPTVNTWTGAMPADAHPFFRIGVTNAP